MTCPLYSLSVVGPPGAVFRVTDGASKCVGTGMHRLNLELPRGIYTVNAVLGQSVETREVLLDRPQSVDLQATIPSFGDVAFSLAPEVMKALGSFEFQAGGQLIALRGPWQDERAAGDRVTLDRDGVTVPIVREGFVSDPQGKGVWSWQLFDLAPVPQPHIDAPGVLTVTRSVCYTTRGTKPDTSSLSHLEPLQAVSHVLPHWGDWVVWAAYPATAGNAPKEVELPLAYYVRLRLTLPHAVPALHLQSLSDQVFTALAARTGLPLTESVLELLLSSNEADPLLALAAAHLASITLGMLGRLRQLPHDASYSKASSAISELQLIDVDALYQQFHTWLDRHDKGPLANSPDMIAARFLFGINTHAHMRVPPVLLRSLDGLFAATESPEIQSVGTTFDDSVWGMRWQISDSFAFLQWQPNADYERQLRANLKFALESAQFTQSTANIIRQVQSEQQSKSSIAKQGRSAVPQNVEYFSTLEPLRKLSVLGLENRPERVEIPEQMLSTDQQRVIERQQAVQSTVAKLIKKDAQAKQKIISHLKNPGRMETAATMRRAMAQSVNNFSRLQPPTSPILSNRGAFGPDTGYAQMHNAAVYRKAAHGVASGVQSSLRHNRKAHLEQERWKTSKSKKVERKPPVKHAAFRSVAGLSRPMPLTESPAFDLQAFIKSSAASFRIPASAMSLFMSTLRSLPLEKSSIEAALKQWAEQSVKKG